MIDVVSLCIAVGAVAISIFSHIRHSRCLHCVEIETYQLRESYVFICTAHTSVCGIALCSVGRSIASRKYCTKKYNNRGHNR